MTTKNSCQIRVGIAILLAALALPLLSSYGDTVTLKSGKKLEGIITLDAADFIKIELSRSGSIKETKLVKKSDIASIVKTKPDTLALAKIKESLPTPSLMTSSSYQNLIKSGPEAFLKAYPDSLHKDEVSKILAELEAEKAKVDRGAVKLEGEWIDAERRQNFKSLVKSKIRVFTMKQKAQQANYTNALRDLQIIEDQFVGTPAYPEAIKIALSILPTYGQLLTRQLKDVEFLNKKRQADIDLLPPTSRAQTEAAYKKEQDTFKALAEQEKKTGIKWRSVNRRNKDSISPMIDTIRQELDRLSKIDTAKLEVEAQQLVKVDELINENKLKEAKELLLESGAKVNASKSSRTRSKTTKSSYSNDLSNKIAAKIQASEDAALNAATNAKAKKDAAAITQSSVKMADKDKSADEKKKDEVKEDDSAADALAAAMAARKKVADAKKEEADAKEAAKASTRPKSTKKKTTPKKRPSSSASSGGGLSFQTLLIGFAIVMGIVIVVLKKLGIGGGAGGSGDDE